MSTPLNGSLLKALEILDLFSLDQREVSAKTVAEQLGMSVPTAHRFLLTLEHAGFTVSPRRGQFTLGQKLEELGKLAFELSPLPALARSEVEAVSRDLNESVMACRMGRSGPLCIASAHSRRPIRVTVDVGTVLPLRTTAQGKLFLAAMEPAERLARARTEGPLDDAGRAALEAEMARLVREGHATNQGENESEIGAIAVPVMGPSGRTELTLSVFGILSRFDAELMARAKTRLAQSKAALEATLLAYGQGRLPKGGARA